MKRILPLSTMLAVLAVPAAGAGIGTAATEPEATIAATTCTSDDPALAERLASDIDGVLQRDPSGIGLTVYDRKTETFCNYNDGEHFFTASIVKVTIVGALLRSAQEEDRDLTQRELDLAHAAITVSDNDATSELRDQLGNDGIQHFMDLAGMDSTLTADGWGSYQTTSEDQVQLLKVLTSEDDVLTADRKAYLLDLMTRVAADQRWGTPAGAPESATVHVKNGWVPSEGWINSIGSFDGPEKDYMMAVLTGNSYSVEAGSARIEAVSNIVHRAFDPGVHVWPMLETGATGVQVQTAQYLLNHHGAGLDVDGIYGSGTETAVRDFQAANGLDADGIVGPATWAKAVVAAKAGDSGDHVTAVQTLLNRWGYEVAVDGTFTAATESAVKEFQTAQNLPSDGVVAESTWQALVT